jgi:hypothetical protein
MTPFSGRRRADSHLCWLVLIAVMMLAGAAEPASALAEEFTCSKTAKSIAEIESDMKAAKGGEIVCVAAGTYTGTIKIKEVHPSSMVTLRAEKGALVNVGFMDFQGTHSTGVGNENLTIRNLNFTSALDLEETEKNVHIEYDTFGENTTGSTVAGSALVTGLPAAAVDKMAVGEAVYAPNISTEPANIAVIKSIPSSTEVELGVAICSAERKKGSTVLCKAGEREQFGEKEGSEYVAHATSTATGEQISVGPPGGVQQADTLEKDKQENVYIDNDTFSGLGPCQRYDNSEPSRANCQTVSLPCYKDIAEISEKNHFEHDVCGPYVSTHYTQPGANQLFENHNLFLGPSAKPVNPQEHMNVLQLAFGGKEDEFSNNILYQVGTNGAIILESSGADPDLIENVTFHNDLQVGQDEGYAVQLSPIKQLSMTNYTVTGAVLGNLLGRAATGYVNGDTNPKAFTDGVVSETGAAACGSSKKEACGVLKSETASFTSADLGSPISETVIVQPATYFEPTTVKTVKSSTEVELSVTAKAGTAVHFSIGREGEKYTITHDIFLNAVKPSKDSSFGACVGECTFEYLVSEDKSADETAAAGSAHHAIEWTPKWEATTWSPVGELDEGNVPKPPTGYYVPEGLAFEAGYQGGGGP